MRIDFQVIFEEIIRIRVFVSVCLDQSSLL